MFDLEFGVSTIFMEASGEPEEGQRAIAHILVNRLNDGRWGKTIATVCLDPFQFSSWNASSEDRKRLGPQSETDPAVVKMATYMREAMDGTDPDNTGGALYYFNPAEASPGWAKTMRQTVAYGKHLFYTDKP